ALAPPAHAQANESGGGWTKTPKPDAKAPAKPEAKPPTPAEKLKQEGKELFGQPGAAQGDKNESGAKGWAVCIAAFKGEGHEQAAATLLAKIRSEGGLPEAYTAKRNDAVIIAVGDFSGPEDE